MARHMDVTMRMNLPALRIQLTCMIWPSGQRKRPKREERTEDVHESLNSLVPHCGTRLNMLKFSTKENGEGVFFLRSPLKTRGLERTGCSKRSKEQAEQKGPGFQGGVRHVIQKQKKVKR